MAKKLNIAGQLTRYFIESRLTLLLVLALICSGLIGLTFTPREENPQIIVPAASISISLPGAPPLEVEHLLLSPLETELLAIEGVKHIYGTALEGQAQIMVEFEVGEDKEDAMVHLYDRILRYRPQLPLAAGEPHIQSIDVDDVPVFTVTLASEKYSSNDLRRMAERMLERLRSEPGIGKNYVVGGLSRAFRIEVSPEKLQIYQMSINQIKMAVQLANSSQPLGLHVYQGKNHSVRITGLLKNIQQINDIVVRHHKGKLLRIRDIATVIDGPPTEMEQFTRFSFGAASGQKQSLINREMAAATLAIAKRSGVNVVTLTAALKKRVSKMAQSLPADVHVIITRDDGVKADNTVTNLVEHLFIAIAAVSLILVLFLGWRDALIVAFAIPLVFATVMAADLLFGPTLNRITLYSLILGLGMLVDDAIVITENIHRHFHFLPANASKAQRSQAAIMAIHEIGNPTTLATFTVVVVFLSLIIVTGMLGQYFYPMTFNLPVAMIASLLIAYTITPWLARRWLRTNTVYCADDEGHLQGWYRSTMSSLQIHRRYRYGFYVIVIVLLTVSLLQPAWQFIRPQGIAGAVSPLGIPLAFLPKDDKNTFLIHVHLPETTPLEVTDQATRELVALLHKNPTIRDYQTHVGYPAVVDFNGQLRGSSANIGPQYAEIRVNLVDKKQRDQTSIDIVRNLRSQVKAIAEHYPGGIIQLVEDPPGPPVRATVLAEIYGSNLKQLEQLAQQVTEQFQKTYDMAEVHASIPFTVSEYQIQINHDKTARAGLNPTQVSQAIQQLMNGEILAYAHPPDERTPIPINLYVPRQQRINPDMLDRAFIYNEQGHRLPLSELTKVARGTRLKPIKHKDTERVEYVGGELAASAPVYAVLDLDKHLDGLLLAEGSTLQTGNLRLNPIRPNTLDGYQLLWEGELRLTLDAFRDMGLALGAALLVIYLLLVGYYRSFCLPFLAMSSIPLGLIGVFPAHWFLGQDFSAASMIGVIALAGVVVRNSLLIIDFAIDYQQQGYSVEKAVLEAGAIRLRPILLTTLAIALGTAIMVPDPVFGGLAIALIFGAISSAFFGLLMLPLLYMRWAPSIQSK